MKERIKTALKNPNVLFFSIFGLLLVSLMCILPMLGDDLLHGSFGVGIHFMEDINGRYLGNLFGINLSSSFLLRILVKTIVLLGIVTLIYKLSSSKKLSVLLLSLLAVLSMPKEMFRQVILNSSGFGNYVIPTFGILLIIFLHFKKQIKKNNIYYLLFFGLGIFNSLFVEHVTIYNVLLSIYLAMYSFIFDKDKKGYFIAYLTGSILGGILMFSNPIYLSSFKGEDDYRSITGIQDMIRKFCLIINEAFLQNRISVISTIICGSIISFNSKKKNVISKMLITYQMVFGTYYVLKFLNPNWLLFKEYNDYFEAIITTGYFISLIWTTLLCDIAREKKYQLVFTIVSYAILLGPLLVVNPVGPRCYIPSYILLLAFLVNNICIFEGKKWISISNLNYVTVPSIAILFIFYFSIYGEIYKVSKNRLDTIKSAIDSGEESVEFVELPYMEYLHGAEICPDYNEKVYRIYYKIDDSIQFVKRSCQ